MLSFLFGLIVGVCLAMVILHVQGRPAAPSRPASSGRTVVELRQTKGTNAKRWTATVKYDSWGTPYVSNNPSKLSAETLRRDGTTSDHWLYGTEWQRLSGPEVTFGERPANAFGAAKRDPNNKETSGA